MRIQHRQTTPTATPRPRPCPPAPSGRGAACRDLPEAGPELRAGLQRREPAALAEFFELYGDRIYGYIRGLIRDEHLAEDLTQDTFASIHARLAHYDPERELAPWVFTIATNKVRDHWRSRRHQDSRYEMSLSMDDSPLEVADERRGPTHQPLADEIEAEVRAAIDQLSEGMRQTVLLRAFEGLSFEAIGALLDRSEVAVRKRYSRALGVLRELLEPSALAVLSAA